MALKIALDTNCYRDFCAGDREVLDRVQLAERVVLPFVTLAELRAGFRCGTRAAENERVLQRFLRGHTKSTGASTRVARRPVGQFTNACGTTPGGCGGQQ